MKKFYSGIMIIAFCFLSVYSQGCFLSFFFGFWGGYFFVYLSLVLLLGFFFGGVILNF